MNPRIFLIAIGAAAFLLSPRLSFAEDQLAKAIFNTKEAIDHGGQGHAELLVADFENALKHAQTALDAGQGKGHVKEGVTHLQAAIAEGRKVNVQAATKHAEEALADFEAAQR